MAKKRFNIAYGNYITVTISFNPLIFKKNNWESTVINPVGDTWESETWGGVTKEEINILSNHKYYEDNKINYSIIPNSIADKFKQYATKNNYLLSKRNIVYFSLLSISTPNLRNFVYNKGNYFNTKPKGINNYSNEFIKEYATMFFLNDVEQSLMLPRTFL